MAHQIPVTPDAVADLPHPDDGTREIAVDLAYKRMAMVNVVLFGMPQCGDRQWVLVDAGVVGLTSLIDSAAEERFGVGARPAAIVITHGHFDHTGSLEKLAEKWDAPTLTGGYTGSPISIGIGNLTGEGDLAFGIGGTGYLTTAGVGATINSPALYTFSLAGTSSLVGPTSDAQEALTVDGLAFNPANSLLYAITAEDDRL